MATVNNWPLEIKNWEFNNGNLNFTAPDPDLEKRGGGGGGGGVAVSKKRFSPLRASVWSKNIGGGGAGPLPWIHHFFKHLSLKATDVTRLICQKGVKFGQDRIRLRPYTDITQMLLLPEQKG